MIKNVEHKYFQLLLQFPCHFEFNLTYLLKLAEHTYSNLFGNFLANSLAERRKLKIKERTRSIWGYLRSHPSKFRNFLFVRRDEVLWPRFEVTTESWEVSEQCLNYSWCSGAGPAAVAGRVHGRDQRRRGSLAGHQGRHF